MSRANQLLTQMGSHILGNLEKNETDNSNTIETSMRDIMTKYIPNEFGLVRPWIEVHSHIPDYSRILNYGICK